MVLTSDPQRVHSEGGTVMAEDLSRVSEGGGREGREL